MSENLLVWLFGAGVAQGLFLIVSLAALRVRNTRARWLLAATIAAFTVMLVEEYFDVSGLRGGVGVGLTAEFAIAPLLYLFVASLADDDPTPLRARWPHAIPFLASAFWLAYLNFGFEERWVSLSNPEVRHLIAGTVFVKIAYFLAYATAILRRPLALHAKPPATRAALRWVRAWFWVFCAAYVFTMASFVAFYLRLDWAVDSDQIGGLLLVGALFTLGYFALANRNVFDARDRKAAPAGDAARLAEKARAWLESSKAYEDPDFALRDLAEAVGAGEAKLSEALNAVDPGGFYALVNDLRLDAFRRLARDPANRTRGVLDLAFEAGFSSKATFYRFFRAREGMTPNAFRAARAAERPA